MRKVLVAYATKMGATRDIAEAIGAELRSAEIDVTVSDAVDLHTLAGYDAAVIGSAVYATRWRPEAIKLLTDHAKAGARIPIWLYQSGPLSSVTDGAGPAAGKKVSGLAASIGSPPPITFGGRVESATAKGFIARRMAAGPGAGDYRDFTQVRRWAAGIGRQLTGSAPQVGPLAGTGSSAV